MKSITDYRLPVEKYGQDFLEILEIEDSKVIPVNENESRRSLSTEHQLVTAN